MCVTGGVVNGRGVCERERVGEENHTMHMLCWEQLVFS